MVQSVPQLQAIIAQHAEMAVEAASVPADRNARLIELVVPADDIDDDIGVSEAVVDHDLPVGSQLENRQVGNGSVRGPVEVRR